MPIQKKLLLRTLSGGQSVMIVPGGVREMLMCDPRRKSIPMSKKHKGFVRVAIQQGVPLVPVMSFGENDNYDNPAITMNRLLYKWIGCPLPPTFTNKYRLPWSNCVRLCAAVGKPIEVKQCDDPTQEEVDRMHTRYYSELDRVFNKYKDQFGYGDRKIEYMD